MNDLALKFQGAGDTTFNKYFAQYEYTRNNFRC